MGKKLTQEEVIVRFEKANGVGKFDYSEVVYKNSQTKVKVFCIKHQQWFYPLPDVHWKDMLRDLPPRGWETWHGGSRSFLLTHGAATGQDRKFLIRVRKFRSAILFGFRLFSPEIQCPQNARIRIWLLQRRHHLQLRILKVQ